MARRQKKQATDTTLVAAPPPPTQLPSPGSPVFTAENFAECLAAHGDETFDPEALAGETSAVEEAASAAAEEGASTAEEAGAGTAAEEGDRTADRRGGGRRRTFHRHRRPRTRAGTGTVAG